VGERRTPEQVRAEIKAEREQLEAGIRAVGAETLRAGKTAVLVALAAFALLALLRLRRLLGGRKAQSSGD